MKKIRTSLAVSIALFLTGCSSNGGDWDQILRATEQIWSGSNDRVSIERASAIPYATLGLKLDDGPEQMLILATDDGGVRLWTSSGHVSLVIQGDRIIRTSGLGTDLTGHSGPVDTAENWLKPHVSEWQGDFPDLGHYSVRISCRNERATPDPIKILGQIFETARVNEDCESKELGWRFSNTYWVSTETMRVWRSIQHIHPRGPELEIEYLRPPFGNQ